LNMQIRTVTMTNLLALEMSKRASLALDGLSVN
jgi:hypothetical protein